MTITTTTLTETQRSRRGHRFYPSATEAKKIPALHSTDDSGPLRERTIYAHYFIGGCDWYVAEYDPAAGVAWGYACLSNRQLAEWGLLSLPELEELSVLGQVVRRDRNWVPISAAKAHMPGEPFRYGAAATLVPVAEFLRCAHDAAVGYGNLEPTSFIADPDALAAFLAFTDRLDAECDIYEDETDETPCEDCGAQECTCELVLVAAPNTNSELLAGMACPECGQFEQFRIDITAMATVSDTGADNIGELDWDDDDYAEALRGRAEHVVDLLVADGRFSVVDRQALLQSQVAALDLVARQVAEDLGIDRTGAVGWLSDAALLALVEGFTEGLVEGLTEERRGAGPGRCHPCEPA